MLIGYGMPAVETVTLAGGTWLTADQGGALFDGRPGRASRIRRTGNISLRVALATPVVPRIIAVLGLSVQPGTTVRAAGATATAIRLPGGSVCAWLLPGATVPVSTVTVDIDTTAINVDIGEIAILQAAEVGISDGWGVAWIDASAHTRTKGGQVNTVPGALYRRLSATLSGRATAVVRKAGMAGGVDWEAIGAALAGRQRGCVIPQHRDMATKQLDAVLAARSAFYGHATQLPTIENLSRQYFSGFLEFEEIPA